MDRPVETVRSGRAALVTIALGALLLGAAVWIASTGKRAGPAATPRGPEPPSGPSARGGAPTSEPVPGLGRTPGARSEEPATRAPLAATDPTQPPITPEPPPPDGIDVRVVTGEAKTPVPGALIAFVDERSTVDEDLLDVRAGTLSMERILARIGRHFRADSRGVARVPAPRGSGFVAGGTPGLWGMVQFPEQATDVELVLAPDPPLRVRVKDDDGRPVGGVPVCLRQRFGDLTMDLFATASASGSGIAELEHVQPLLRNEERDAESYAALAILAEEPVEAPIDPGDLPSEPIELVLPPTGSVEVLIRDPAGEALAEAAVVRMTRAGDGRDDARDLERGDRVQVVAEGGRAFFPHVALGLDLALVVEPVTGYGALRLHHAGPGTAGEQVTVLAALTELLPVLSGRVVGPDGEPLAGYRLDARLVTDTAESKQSIVHAALRTDAEGRFRMPLSEEPVDPPGRAVLELATDGPDGAPLTAAVPLRARPVAGSNDLGTIALAMPPLIASGRVIDPAGQPIPGARVLVEVPSTRETTAASNVWRTAWELRTRTDPWGRFVVRGELDATAIALTASHLEHVAGERTETVVGSKGIEIVLERAGELAGNLLLPEGTPGEGFLVRALREGDRSASTPGRIDASGAFEVSGLLEGTYTVEILLREEPDCSLSIHGIAVREGATTRDERLREVDLRGRVRSFTIELQDEEGRPVAQGSLSRRRPGTEEGVPQRVWEREGRFTITTCCTSLDIEVDAPGFRTELLEGVGEDRTVTLRRGPRVRLVVPNAPALADGRFLGVQLRRAAVGRWRPPALGWLDPDGSVRLFAKAPGPHEVVLVVAERVGGRRSTHQVSAGPEAVIEVADSGDEQVFEIRLSEATLRNIGE